MKKTRDPEKEIRQLRKVLRCVVETLELSDPMGDRATHITAPEDSLVLDFCQQIGFGAVMDSAARQWRKERRWGDGAFVCGPCVGTVRKTLQQVRDALAGRFE